MPSVDEIRTLTIKAISDGLDKATADVNSLAAAQGGLAVVSDTTTKATTGVAQAYERAQRSLDVNYRSTVAFNTQQLAVTRAYNEGLSSLDRYNQLTALNATAHGLAGSAAKTFAAALSGVSGQLVAMAAGAGPVSVFLSALGPWGIAAAAAIGLLTYAFNAAVEGAKLLAGTSQELNNLSRTSLVSVEGLQAIFRVAATFSVGSEQAGKMIDHFTEQFHDLNNATGPLYEAILKVNQGIALQMVGTHDATTMINLFAKAWSQADQAQQALLSKSAFGRQGIPFSPVLGVINDQGGVDQMVKSMNSLTILTAKQTKEMDDLKTQTDENNKLAAQIVQSLYGPTVLAALKAQSDASLQYAINLKEAADQAERLKSSIGIFAYLPQTPPGSDTGMPSYVSPQGQTAVNQDAGRSKLKAGSGTPLGDYPKQFQDLLNVMDPMKSALDAVSASMATIKSVADSSGVSLTAQANIFKALISAMGPAVTLQMQMESQLKELAKAVDNHTGEITKEQAALADTAIRLAANIQQESARNAVLGVSATVSNVVQQKTNELEQKRASLVGSNAQLTEVQIANAKRLIQAQADGTFQMQAQIDVLNVQAKTIGMTTAQAETYTIIQTKMNQNVNAGLPPLTDITDAFRKFAELQGQAKQNSELAVELDKAQFDAKTALLDPLEKEIALLQKKNGINPQTDDIANIKRTTDATKEAQSAAISFGQDFAHSMEAGKSFTDSLTAALKNLSAKLADKAIVDLLSGNYEKAAIEGAAAIATYVASLFTGDSTQKLKDQIALIDKVNALQARNVAATTDQTTLAGQLAVFDTNANLQRIQEARDGNTAIVQLEQTLALERQKVIDDFNTQALATAQQAAAAQEQVMQAAQQRIQSAQDRLFTATNDPNTLEGQLAAFDRQAQADQLAEQQAGGQAMVDLEAAQGQERLNIIKNYNQQITDAATQAAQTQLDAITKAAQTIRDYLNNLNVGTDSALSPQDRLAAAQSSYNAKLALAQSGNTDAASSITTDAENLRKAAQDFYASGSGYQTILSQIQSSLLALPQVTQTDPVVTAVNAATAAIVQTNALTTASNNLQDTANGIALVANSILSGQTSLLTAINTLSDRDVNAINGLGSLTAQIASTHSNQFNTMISLLGTIAAKPTSGSGSIWSWLGFQNGGMIPGFAGGGMIGNGVYNVDSVRARYAGGGDIALAGGEFITRATSVNASTMRTLQYMNDNGRPPANDNREYFAMVDRTNAAGFSAMIEEIRQLRAVVAEGARMQAKATERNAPKVRPGKAA